MCSGDRVSYRIVYARTRTAKSCTSTAACLGSRNPVGGNWFSAWVDEYSPCLLLRRTVATLTSILAPGKCHIETHSPRPHPLVNRKQLAGEIDKAQQSVDVLRSLCADIQRAREHLESSGVSARTAVSAAINGLMQALAAREQVRAASFVLGVLGVSNDRILPVAFPQIT